MPHKKERQVESTPEEVQVPFKGKKFVRVWKLYSLCSRQTSSICRLMTSKPIKQTQCLSSNSSIREKTSLCKILEEAHRGHQERTGFRLGSSNQVDWTQAPTRSMLKKIRKKEWRWLPLELFWLEGIAPGTIQAEAQRKITYCNLLMMILSKKTRLTCKRV